MSKAIELALKKQRLQFASAALRRELVRDFDDLAPVANAARRIHAGWDWLRAYPALAAAFTVALIVARPRWMLRWAQRGYMAWRAWRALRARLDH